MWQLRGIWKEWIDILRKVLVVWKHLYVVVGPGDRDKKTWRGGRGPLQLGEAGQGLPLPHLIFTKKTRKCRKLPRVKGLNNRGQFASSSRCRRTHTLPVKSTGTTLRYHWYHTQLPLQDLLFLFEKGEMKSSTDLVNPTFACWQCPARVWLPWQCLPGELSRGFRLCLSSLSNPCSSKGLLAADCSGHKQGSEPQAVSDTADIFCENHSSGSWNPTLGILESRNPTLCTHC